MSYFLGFNPADTYTTLCYISVEVSITVFDPATLKITFSEDSGDQFGTGVLVESTIIDQSVDEHGVVYAYRYEQKYLLSPLKTAQATDYTVYARLYNNGTGDYINGGSMGFTTHRDSSFIAVVKAEKIKEHSAKLKTTIQVNAYKGRTDNYRVEVYFFYHKPPAQQTPPTYLNYQYLINTTGSSAIDENTQSLTKLKRNRKYYFQICLINLNSYGEQIIDTYDGFFKTAGGFPLWMYLWYKI